MEDNKSSIFFKIDKDEKTAIETAAKELDLSVSQFIRHAAREKITAMKQAQQAEAAATR